MGMGCIGWNRRGSAKGNILGRERCQKGEYQRTVISKGVIPKSKGKILGGAKVSMGVQRRYQEVAKGRGYTKGE